MIRWCVVLGIAGCRFQFTDLPPKGDADSASGDSTIEPAIDAPSDAITCASPIGHDEDGDTIDDACDLCPAIADNQLDTDADKVGDACDPLPLSATERISYFDPFTATNAEWAYGSIAQVMNDTLVIAAANGGTTPELATPPARERYTIVGSVGNVGNGNPQLAIQIGDSTMTGIYYCELYQNATSFVVSLTYTRDGSMYSSTAMMPITSQFKNGPLVLTLDHYAPTLACHARWAGQSYDISSPIPTGITAAKVFLAITNADIVLTSFTRITSTP